MKAPSSGKKPPAPASKKISSTVILTILTGGLIVGAIAYGFQPVRCIYDPMQEENLLLETCATTAERGLLPKSMRALASYKASVNYHSAGQMERAAATAERALELDPNLSAARVHLVRVELQIGQSRLANKDFRGAVQSLTKAIEHDPGASGAWLSRGIAYNALKEHRAAVSDFDEEIRLDPSFFGTFANRGYAHLRLEQWAAARDDFSAALQRDSTYSAAYMPRATARRMLRDYSGALEDAERALQADAKSKESYFEKTWALVNLKKYDQAKLTVEQWEQLTGKSVDSETAQARILEETGYFRSAVDAYDRAITLDPKNAYVLRSRGVVKWFSLGQRDAALEDFEDAIALGDELARDYKQQILKSGR